MNTPYVSAAPGTKDNPLRMSRGEAPLHLPTGTKLVFTNIARPKDIHIIERKISGGRTFVLFERRNG